MRSPWKLRAHLAAAGIAFSAVLGGCASTPTQYYTLDMRPSASAKPTCNLAVGTIGINEPLAQKNLLIKKSPTQVEYYAVGAWAGGLDEMLIEKLTAEFGARDPKARTLVLTGNLLAFEQVDVSNGAEAHLRFDGELRESGKSRITSPLLKKTYDINLPASAPGANEVATALSRCVEKLAAEISADAAAL